LLKIGDLIKFPTSWYRCDNVYIILHIDDKKTKNQEQNIKMYNFNWEHLDEELVYLTDNSYCELCGGTDWQTKYIEVIS
jgi:hypothetical protein